MNFTYPPLLEDVQNIADQALENLPDEFAPFTEDLAVRVEEIADDAIQAEMDLTDPYELVALYRSGREVLPGVQRKLAKDNDILILYRRPLLDLWSETGEDITVLTRQVMIEELGNSFDFSESDIDDMTRRHHQGML